MFGQAELWSRIAMVFEILNEMTEGKEKIKTEFKKIPAFMNFSVFFFPVSCDFGTWMFYS
jgi:hypothetical protein